MAWVRARWLLQSDGRVRLGWLDAHHPRSLEEWRRLFKRTFRFTGGEIVRAFLVSTGYLPARITWTARCTTKS